MTRRTRRFGPDGTTIARRWQELPVSIAVACIGPTSTNTTHEQPWWARVLYAIVATTKIAYDTELAEKVWKLTVDVLDVH